MILSKEVLNKIQKFDSLKLSNIESLKVENKENDYGDWECQVFVISNYWQNTLLQIQFQNVKRMKLPEFGESSLLSFAELLIEDVSTSGLEGIKYSVVDHVNGFYCDCQDILVDFV